MQTVLVTGATSGFGKGLVRRLLEEGYQVVATGRNLSKRPELLQEERSKFGTRLIEKNLDVTSTADLNEIAAYFQNHPLDILINNAGYAVFGPAEECSEEKIRQQFEVNFFGLVLLTQKLLPTLRSTKGRIINFSSVLGLVGFPLSGPYCASKFAVEGFSEALSYELKPHGVRVTLIEPGGYKTNFNSSAEWGMTVNPNSAYYTQVQNYLALRTKMFNRPNSQDPADVVEGVIKVLKKDCPKINYTFGRDARFTRVLRKILPRAIYHQVSRFFLNRLFTKKLA
jgi:short-subunit dehydrogenase